MPKILDDMPPVADLLQHFEYNPHTGLFSYRKTDDVFSTQAPGEPAFTSDSYVGLYQWIPYKGRRYLITANRAAYALGHGKWPDGVVKHKDGDKRNNRLNNLYIPTKRPDNTKPLAQFTVKVEYDHLALRYYVVTRSRRKRYTLASYPNRAEADRMARAIHNFWWGIDTASPL